MKEDWVERGRFNALMDANENAPCASIGGLGQRHAPEIIFDWVPEQHKEEFIQGYEEKCEEMWGSQWRDIAFSWRPVLQINGKGIHGVE